MRAVLHARPGSVAPERFTTPDAPNGLSGSIG